MLINQVSLTKSGRIRKGFQRREDLTETIRMNIAVRDFTIIKLPAFKFNIQYLQHILSEDG